MTRAEDEQPDGNNPVRSWLRGRRGAFLLIVVAPTLLVFGYLLLFASPQYESRSEYLIRGMKPEAPAIGGLAQVLGGSQASVAGREAEAIKDYLLSHDVIAGLRSRGVDVVQIYRRQGLDPISRLRFANPRAETLLEYYRDHVDVDYDRETGATRIAVRAFAPADARQIAKALIELGEQQVNTFNSRAASTGIGVAQRDVGDAERELLAIQGRLTGFRDVTGDIDPSRSSEGERQQLQQLQAELGRQRAILVSMSTFLAASSPQVQVQRSRVGALERSIAQAQGKLTGNSEASSRRLATYEELKLRQDFARKRYEAARAALETARAEVDRQRLFFVSVVTPNMPEKPVRPMPFRTGLTLLAALAVAYAIGWLILAGIREHEAD